MRSKEITGLYNTMIQCYDREVLLGHGEGTKIKQKGFTYLSKYHRKKMNKFLFSHLSNFISSLKMHLKEYFLNGIMKRNILASNETFLWLLETSHGKELHFFQISKQLYANHLLPVISHHIYFAFISETGAIVGVNWLLF